MSAFARHVRHAQLAFEMANTLLGFLLCFMVIYLALFRTVNKEVAVYRKMLITTALIDIGYLTSIVFGLPSCNFTVNVYFFLFDNPFMPNNGPLLHAAFISHIFFIYMSIAILPLQFIYRFRMLRDGRVSWRFMATLFAAAFAYVFIHSILAVWTTTTPNGYYDNILKSVETFKDQDIPLYIAGDSVAQPVFVFHMMDCAVMGFAAYTVIGLYYVKIERKLEQVSCHMSEATKRTQRLLTKILRLQAAYPLLLIIFPSFVWGFLPILHVESPYVGNIISVCIHLTPTLNSLAVLMGVPSYRRYIYTHFCRVRDLDSSTKAHTTNSSANASTMAVADALPPPHASPP